MTVATNNTKLILTGTCCYSTNLIFCSSPQKLRANNDQADSIRSSQRQLSKAQRCVRLGPRLGITTGPVHRRSLLHRPRDSGRERSIACLRSLPLRPPSGGSRLTGEKTLGIDVARASCAAIRADVDSNYGDLQSPRQTSSVQVLRAGILRARAEEDVRRGISEIFLCESQQL